MTPLERATRAVSADMKRAAFNLSHDAEGNPKRSGVWLSAVAADEIRKWAAQIDAALEEGPG